MGQKEAMAGFSVERMLDDALRHLQENPSRNMLEFVIRNLPPDDSRWDIIKGCGETLLARGSFSDERLALYEVLMSGNVPDDGSGRKIW
jgi:hypothetical protein